MSKRNDRITVRLSTEEKQCIEEAAMKLGINSSQYIRTIALNKNKLIFLNESGGIANAITKLQIDFDRATRTKALSSENEQYMLKALDLLVSKFNELIDYTTQIDVDEDDEEVE